MKSTPYLAIVAAMSLAAFPAKADPKSDVASAIKKLGDQSSYTWVSTPKTEGSESGRRAGPIEGATEKAGFTRIKGTMGETAYEVGFQGEKMVVNYNGDWLSTAEVGENNSAIRRLRAFKKPVEEAGELLTRAKEIKPGSGGPFTGDLSPEAAKDLFAQLGRRAAEAPEAQGTLKFWVADGQLAKYEFTVRGKITAGEDKREVEVSRTTTVEIKDAGTTKVSFPDEAKKKLSAP